MARSRPFLTARWANLALVTYAVDPALLAPHLPPGCEADTIGGRGFVSLVAFDFLDTRVLGVPWPGYTCFPEVNLRLYVRHGADRGVAFVGELVPRRLVATLANLFYNEPYAAVAMSSRTTTDATTITVEHHVARAGRPSRLRIVGDRPAARPPVGGEEDFFKEHRWGFGWTRGGELLRYEVNHPPWDLYPIRSLDLDWDWPSTYGEKWAFLRDRRPHSVLFAAGSEVNVYPKGVCRAAREAVTTVPVTGGAAAGAAAAHRGSA